MEVSLNPPSPALAQAFDAGNYDAVVKAFETNRASALELAQPWRVVGALVFKGRLTEAITVHESHRHDAEADIAGRFFLGLGHTRVSAYDRAQALFAENASSLRGLRGRASHRARFFAYQGLAFYRFFSGRFARAELAALRSAEAAFASDFTYGQALALELLGHSKIQRGRVREGLGDLGSAITIARRLGNGGLAAAFEMSALRYECQFGIHASDPVAALEGALASLKEQETYSRGELHLELARQLILRGEASRARRLLEASFDVVYRNRNRRQAATLNLRYAHLMHLRGEDSQALHFLRTAENNLIHSVDAWLLCQMAGLRFKIASRIGDEQTLEEARSFLVARSATLDSATNRRVLAREIGATAPPSNFGEDPTGDLIDAAWARSPEALPAILDRKLYGLLYDQLELDRAAPALAFDLVPGSLTLFSGGDVDFIPRGVNGVLRKLAHRLSRGLATKEELVVVVWGYEYHPLRHDALVYATIAKLRQLLGRHEDWVEWTERGYRLRADARVRFLRPITAGRGDSDARARVEDRADMATENVAASDFNYRQLQALEVLRERAFIGVADYARLFEVSKITASRDLSELRARGALVAVGRARATRYARSEPGGSKRSLSGPGGQG